MMKQVGLWIDRKKAVVVIQNERGETIHQVESEVGRHISYRGASRPKSPYSAQYQQGEDQLDNKYAEHLKKFYDKVIAFVRDAQAVFILGPGEAKVELGRRLAHEYAGIPVVGVQTADKLTDRQIAAKVRAYFNERKK